MQAVVNRTAEGRDAVLLLTVLNEAEVMAHYDEDRMH